MGCLLSPVHGMGPAIPIMAAVVTAALMQRKARASVGAHSVSTAREGAFPIGGPGRGGIMTPGRLKLPRVLGIPIFVDLSWFFVAALIGWSLAAGVFPALLPGRPGPLYLWMAVAGTLGLFVCVLLHELAHSLVARRFGMRINGITLFIFGGVAEIADEPGKPSQEFLVAIAGPAASGVIAAACWALARQLPDVDGWPAVAVTLAYLGQLNAYLALFNLVPAFPLDGGRVLRAALWRLRDDYAWATRVAAACGDLFGLFLIAMGFWNAVTGDVMGGLWGVIVGMFLRNAAASGYRDMQVRTVLGGTRVADVMTPDPIYVSPQAVVGDFLTRYVYRYHHRSFPVVWDGRVMGVVGIPQVAALASDEWSATPVRDIMVPCGEEDVIAADAGVVDAFRRLGQIGRSRLWVLDQGRLVGVIAARDLMVLASLATELPALARHGGATPSGREASVPPHFTGPGPLDIHTQGNGGHHA
ncbi:site-2 protease family protein [Nitrospirillum sp. BR 11163]|uniref:site-2 protease family protein n=1 Tax=Nitrospirillum sp. BR 11163 TaxID=3104323 RepID=UPI002AFF6216|nr:site-2 protease family protein [Nitrospirillum sp. BR 11163]MEA1673283.1 site-2 protease family protein [Nitrospirillum sp. BR 11163]